MIGAGLQRPSSIGDHNNRQLVNLKQDRNFCSESRQFYLLVLYAIY